MTIKLETLMQVRPVFVNVGVRDFGESLREEGYEVVFVDWIPPAGGDARIAEILDDLL